MTTQEVIDSLEQFQLLMVQMLSRNRNLELFEQFLLKCNLTKLNVYDNSFIRGLIANYVWSQLIDIRKYFEQLPQSHRLQEITSSFPDCLVKSKTRHDEIYKNLWESTGLKDLANKKIAHLEKDFDTSDPLKTTVFDIVEQLNNLLDLFIDELRSCNIYVTLVPRAPEDEVFTSILPQGFERFIQILKKG